MGKQKENCIPESLAMYSWHKVSIWTRSLFIGDRYPNCRSLDLQKTHRSGMKRFSFAWTPYTKLSVFYVGIGFDTRLGSHAASGISPSCVLWYTHVLENLLVRETWCFLDSSRTLGQNRNKSFCNCSQLLALRYTLHPKPFMFSTPTMCLSHTPSVFSSGKEK